MLTLLVGSSAAADPPAGCTATAGVTTCVFVSTAAAQTWTVPIGVTSATFDLLGAQGGANVNGDAQGGKGAEVQATIPLTPGQSLQINVGGAGSPGNDCFANGRFNGGGVVPNCNDAGVGGGASDVRQVGIDLGDRVLVAGGGGGAGGPTNIFHAAYSPGAAGGDSSSAGTSAPDNPPMTGGGGGHAGSPAGDSAGGSAGTGGESTVPLALTARSVKAVKATVGRTAAAAVAAAAAITAVAAAATALRPSISATPTHVRRGRAAVVAVAARTTRSRPRRT